MNKIKIFIRGLFRVYCREFKLVIHDPGIILFITFLPLVYPIIYSLIYNPELVKEVPMVVVDNDRTPLSRELVRNLDACDQVWVRGYAADLSEARHAMDSHKCFAILEIPSGFERKIGRTETANAVMYCDMTLLLRYRGFLVASTEVMQAMGGELLSEEINNIAPLAGTIVTGDLLPIENAPMGNIRGGFDSFIMPGVLVLILHQCIILAFGMAGGARRENSGLTGYNPHNNSRYILGTMIGKSLCYFTLLIVPSIYMIHYVPLMFHFPMAGDIWQELSFLLPMSIACFGIGFVFQAFVTERESVFVSWVVTSLVFLLLSGLIWPRYDMPPVWKALSDICPSTWAVEGFVKMNSNGATIGQVSHEYRMLWILAVAWNAVGYCAQKWFMGSRKKKQEPEPDRLMNLFEKTAYYIVYPLLWCLSLLPLRVMYVISDLVAWMLRDIVRYRRSVVRDNLASAFPEKSETEINDIARRFYSFLADYFFETLKMLTMSRKTILRRLTVENVEIVDEAVAQGRSVTLLLGHYCNWEWVSSLPIRFTPDTVSAQVYHYLHSRVMDRIFMKIRTRFEAHNIEMGDIMRWLIDHKRKGVPTVTGFIADQCPKYDIHLFVDFLHHDTGVYTGPERIARFLDSEVLFCHMRRPRRGQYVLRFVPVTTEPKKDATFDITRRYIEMLEANIREAPQFWLWSHRRWKRTRADFYEHWGDHADKMLSHL